MEEIVIGASRIRFFVLLLASLGFVAGGVFILLLGKSPLVGWMGIVFFGACALVAAWQIVDNRPRLTITRAGIEDRTLGVGLIPWSEIDGAYLQSIHGNPFICLEVRDPERFIARMPPLMRAGVGANQALGFTPLSLNVSNLNADPYQVFDLIQRKIAADRAV